MAVGPGRALRADRGESLRDDQDWSPFEFSDLFAGRRRHIERVEEQSDAYHLRFGDKDVMVAYLLEVTFDRTR